jgi:thioredoxin 1
MHSPAATAVPTDGEPRTAQGWWVICLCAGWCGVCREYRSLFDRLALTHPEARFEWVDVEDEDALVGDVDVETFPTLLIADGQQARFLGPLVPQAGVLERLLISLREQANHGAPPLGAEMTDIFVRVRATRS